MTRLYLANEADRRELQRLRDQLRQAVVSTRARGPVATDDLLWTPEVYVAKTPAGGIPGLLPDGLPGYQYCDIYRILRRTDAGSTGSFAAGTGTGTGTHFGTGTGTGTGRDERDYQIEAVYQLNKFVFNIGTGAIPGDTWVLLIRDKYGSWIAQGGAPDIKDLEVDTECVRGLVYKYARVKTIKQQEGRIVYGDKYLIETTCIPCLCTNPPPGTGTGTGTGTDWDWTSCDDPPENMYLCILSSNLYGDGPYYKQNAVGPYDTLPMQVVVPLGGNQTAYDFRLIPEESSSGIPYGNYAMTLSLACKFYAYDSSGGIVRRWYVQSKYATATSEGGPYQSSLELFEEGKTYTQVIQPGGSPWVTFRWSRTPMVCTVGGTGTGTGGCCTITSSFCVKLTKASNPDIYVCLSTQVNAYMVTGSEVIDGTIYDFTLYCLEGDIYLMVEYGASSSSSLQAATCSGGALVSAVPSVELSVGSSGYSVAETTKPADADDATCCDLCECDPPTTIYLCILDPDTEEVVDEAELTWDADNRYYAYTIPPGSLGDIILQQVGSDCSLWYWVNQNGSTQELPTYGNLVIDCADPDSGILESESPEFPYKCRFQTVSCGVGTGTGTGTGTGGGGGGNRIHDKFNVSDQTNAGRTPDTTNVPGNTWSNALGTASVVSNTLRATSYDTSLGASIVRTVIDNGQRAAHITADMYLGNSGLNGGLVDIFFRYADASNFWVVRISKNIGADNLIQIGEMSGGSYSVRSSVSCTINFSTVYSLTLTDDGTAIAATIDGNTANYSSTSGNANTLVGVQFYSGDGGYYGSYVDEFVVVS